MAARSEAWIVVTGGGSGIGRGLVHHFSRTHNVLTCGRRHVALQETQRLAPRPSSVTIVACDIGDRKGRENLLRALPAMAQVKLLVQNAAIGDPGPLSSLDIDHFEHTLRINVVAPLALTQAFLPALKAGRGRILHIGTSVAFQPQPGTATYGVSKMAFHRLYQQLNKEDLGDVVVGSLSPGLVDTEGVRDHVAKARALDLPHVKFFDSAFDQGWTTNMDDLAKFVDHLVDMPAENFISKEWRFSEWRTKVMQDQASPPQQENAMRIAVATFASIAFGAAVFLALRPRGRL